ncbi:MAG TPA: hypothetical protein VML35_00635 [Gaiellaceae bacterium]|nr:hypothetical protein [Gaiellaceae bacterium]
MRKLLLAAVAALALAVSAPALAADGTTTFGAATITDGVATLVSNTSNTDTADDFSGVGFPLPAGLTLAQITELSAEYNVTNDDCAGGSPRFVINYGTNENMVVYFGPAPTFTGCAQDTWLSTGNLVGTADACRVDTSQLSPGTQCSTWAAAVALVGSRPINSISIVVDGSWALADKEQTILVRNVKLNDKTYLTPEAPKPPKAKVNPTTACKAQQAALGRAAFNELWATSGTQNGFGKCVSAAAKARNLGAVQTRIMNASKTCKAKGFRGERLGQCVAATDRVAATKTEAEERKAAAAKKGKSGSKRP